MSIDSAANAAWRARLGAWIDATQASHDVEKNKHVEDQHLQTRVQIDALAQEVRSLREALDMRQG